MSIVLTNEQLDALNLFYVNLAHTAGLTPWAFPPGLGGRIGALLAGTSNLVSLDQSAIDELTPIAGDIVWNTDEEEIQFYNGSVWGSLGGGAPSGPAGGILSGTYPNPSFSTTAPLNNVGSFVAATYYQGSQASNTQKISIDNRDFVFVSALGAPSSSIQVKIGASLAADIDTMTNAINGVADINVVQPSPAFTSSVRAVSYPLAQEIYLFAAASRGGVPALVAAPAIPLGTNIPSGQWDVNNLNRYGSGAPSTPKMHRGQFVITSDMLAFGVAIVFVPFSPSMVFVTVKNSSNVFVVRSDTWDIEPNSITAPVGAPAMFAYFLAGGGEPATQAGDTVCYMILE